MYGERLERWNRIADWPLIGAAIVFLIAYAVEILGPQTDPLQSIIGIVLWIVWAFFAVDYIVSLVLAEHRGRWFVRHLLDLLIAVLPMLRPLRLMRFLTILAMVQKGAGSALRGRVAIYAVGATALTIFVAALAVLDAEQGAPGANISDFGEAIWWAFTTITTVGYGDYYPVTVVGRIVAVALMVGGIALIGVVTATLASWLVERVAADADRRKAASARQVAELGAEISALRAELAERGGATRAGSAS